MSAPSPTPGSTRAARLAATEGLRELLRRHGKGGTLLEAPPPGEGKPGAPLGAPPEAADAGVDASWAAPGHGAVAVVWGGWSSGKTSVALSRVVRATVEGARAAVVDGEGALYPPALAALGAELGRVVLVRPPVARAVWAGEQLLRSGLFAVVVLLGGGGIDRASLRRLQLAAERGGAGCVVVAGSRSRVAPGLAARRLRVRAVAPDALAGAGGGAGVAAPPRRHVVEPEGRGEGGRGPRRSAVAWG